MQDQSLFRQEAIAHQQQKWSGHAMLTSGCPTWIVVSLSCAAMLVLLVFLVCGSYTRRINVSSEVITQPHTIQLFAQQQGSISAQFVDAPDRVKKGAHIYQIDVSRSTRSGNVSERTVASTREQLAQVDHMMATLEDEKRATLTNLHTQLDQLLAAQKTSHAQMEHARQAMATTRQTMDNFEAYLRQGLVTKEQVSTHQAQFYQQQSAYQAISSQVSQQAIAITKLHSEIATRGLDLDNQLSRYRNQNSQLQQQLTEADASGALFADSPVDGQLAAAAVTPGQMVNAGDLLAQIVPTVDYAYQLAIWVPNNSVPYVAVNDRINIRYDAFPFEKFGQFSGKIIAMATVPSTAQEMSNYTSAPRDGQPYYKAIARLDKNTFTYKDKSLLLSSGMKAQVTLFLEERPLYQWMFAPFYDAAKGVRGLK
jgi:membrane fusion protein